MIRLWIETDCGNRNKAGKIVVSVCENNRERFPEGLSSPHIGARGTSRLNDKDYLTQEDYKGSVGIPPILLQDQFAEGNPFLLMFLCHFVNPPILAGAQSMTFREV